MFVPSLYKNSCLTCLQFSQVITNIIEAIVSIKRLSSFLAADELQPDARKLIERSSLRIGDEVCLSLPEMRYELDW